LDYLFFRDEDVIAHMSPETRKYLQDGYHCNGFDIRTRQDFREYGIHEFDVIEPMDRLFCSSDGSVYCIKLSKSQKLVRYVNNPRTRNWCQTCKLGRHYEYFCPNAFQNRPFYWTLSELCVELNFGYQYLMATFDERNTTGKLPQKDYGRRLIGTQYGDQPEFDRRYPLYAGFDEDGNIIPYNKNTKQRTWQDVTLQKCTFPICVVKQSQAESHKRKHDGKNVYFYKESDTHYEEEPLMDIGARTPYPAHLALEDVIGEAINDLGGTHKTKGLVLECALEHVDDTRTWNKEEIRKLVEKIAEEEERNKHLREEGEELRFERKNREWRKKKEEEIQREAKHLLRHQLGRNSTNLQLHKQLLKDETNAYQTQLGTAIATFHGQKPEEYKVLEKEVLLMHQKLNQQEKDHDVLIADNIRLGKENTSLRIENRNLHHRLKAVTTSRDQLLDRKEESTSKLSEAKIPLLKRNTEDSR